MCVHIPRHCRIKPHECELAQKIKRRMEFPRASKHVRRIPTYPLGVTNKGEMDSTNDI